MKIVTVYPRFVSRGGAQDMAIAIAEGLCDNEIPVILYDNPDICEYYRMKKVRFEKMSLKILYAYYREGAVFISHHRKTTTYLQIVSLLFFFNRIKVIHVAHNTFNTLKLFTLLPKYIVSVSKSVKMNLMNYFKISESNIHVIYNGIIDKWDKNKDVDNEDNFIKILFVGRVVPVKRQLEFFRETQGKLLDSIKIYFAGKGEDYETLATETADNKQYITLGMVDIYQELYKYDYVCLFSENEGLPLSLIEGCMFAKPLVTNNLSAALEVNHPGYNGYVARSWDEIINMINRLPTRNTSEYIKLSENSRILFEQEFNYDTMINNYKKYIQSINW